MVDFELIQRALDEAVSDAEELYNRRKVEYAGYEKSGKVAAYADAMVEAQKARAEFNTLRRAMEWQPIETAPKDGTPIFGCLDGDCYTGHGFLPVCVRWGTFHPNATGKATWRAAHGYKVERLTHWMPLPPPPKGED